MKKDDNNLKKIVLKYTLEDWKNGTYGGQSFRGTIEFNKDLTFREDDGEMYTLYIEKTKEVQEQILIEQEKAYNKEVEHLTQKIISNFNSQYQLRENGQKLLGREIEELEKVFFEENLSILGMKMSYLFSFDMLLQFFSYEERKGWFDKFIWELYEERTLEGYTIDKIRMCYKEIFLEKKTFRDFNKNTDATPNSNASQLRLIEGTYTGFYFYVRVKAWEKYYKYLIALKANSSLSQPLKAIPPKVAPEDVQHENNQIRIKELEQVRKLVSENELEGLIKAEKILVEKLNAQRMSLTTKSDVNQKFELEKSIEDTENELKKNRQKINSIRNGTADE